MSAKLRVSPDLLELLLFQDIAFGVSIVGASFDRGQVILELDGPNVPAAAEVRAIVTEQRRTVKLEPLEPL